MSEHPILALVRSKIDPSRPFVIVAELQAHPGGGDAVASAIAGAQIIPLTRKETGCGAYDICRDTESPDRFVLYERWHDLNALKDHLATAHFAAASEFLANMLASAPAIRVLTSME